MEEILSIFSLLFFYISCGTVFKYYHSFDYQVPIWGAIMSFTVWAVSCSIPVILYCVIFNIAWYWAIILNAFGCFILSQFIAPVYCSIWGYKTKPFFDYTTGKTIKKHLYEYDTCITMTLAIILFAISLSL